MDEAGGSQLKLLIFHKVVFAVYGLEVISFFASQPEFFYTNGIKKIIRKMARSCI